MKKSVLLICLCLFARGVEPAWPEPAHDNAGIRCLDCHVTLPFEEAEFVFHDDTQPMCVKCHVSFHCKNGRECGFSHPLEVVSSINIPLDMPLDKRRRLTCITCHLFHDSDRPTADLPSMLRRPPGLTFCYSCHERLPAP